MLVAAPIGEEGAAHDSTIDFDLLGGTDLGLRFVFWRGPGNSGGSPRTDHDTCYQWQEWPAAGTPASEGDCRLRRSGYPPPVVGGRSFHRQFRRSAVAARSRRFCLPADLASEGQSLPEGLQTALQP